MPLTKKSGTMIYFASEPDSTAEAKDITSKDFTISRENSGKKPPKGRQVNPTPIPQYPIPITTAVPRWNT